MITLELVKRFPKPTLKLLNLALKLRKLPCFTIGHSYARLGNPCQASPNRALGLDGFTEDIPRRTTLAIRECKRTFDMPLTRTSFSL